MAEPDAAGPQTSAGPPSSPEEDTYEEKQRGERNDEEFEAVRHTRLREPDGIPPISVTRGYGAHEPIDDYRYEYVGEKTWDISCLLYTSPSPRDKRQSRMPSSA